MQGATIEGGVSIINRSVSIHAPYAGSDVTELYNLEAQSGFQSTPPMQGATFSLLCRSVSGNRVSIHAPYAGSDKNRQKEQTPADVFQSTPPMQGATE